MLLKNRWLAMSLLLTSLFLLLSCAHNCNQQGEGAFLVLEEDTHDFGQITSGEVVSHVFKFQNCGTDTLRIKRVRGT
jgi:hypothetical protein